MAILTKKNHFFALAAATVFLFGGVIGYGYAQNATEKQKIEQPLVHVNPEKLFKPSLLKDMIEGDANAPVTIVEYASLTCSHCAEFVVNTLPKVIEKYINTGKARLVFREFPYDDRATVGFMLARCVPEDRYFPFVQLLFEKQEEWAFVRDALAPLKQLSKLAGIDDNKFEVCLKDQKVLDGLQATVKRGKDEFGIRATPTFFINGDPVEGSVSIDKISAIIDKKLAESGANAASSGDSAAKGNNK